MKIVYRYIAQTVLTSTFLVLLILLSLYTFMDFIAELDDLGKGNYQLPSILAYLLFSMPNRAYELLPIAALLGSVLGLGLLASQGELVAMRAAGLSIQQINQAVALVALCLIILSGFIGEVLRPIAEQKAQSIRSVAQTGTVEMQSKHGFWTRNGLHFNHISRISPDGHFEDILIYQFDNNHRLRAVTQAKQANYQGDNWLLTDVVQSNIDKNGVQVKSVQHATWIATLNPGILDIVVMEPNLLPIWELIDYIDYLLENGQAISHYQMAFWTKIILPISSAVMVFIAVPFVFGPLRTAAIGGRILFGTLIGIGFHLFNQSLQHIGLVFGIMPWLSAALPTLTFALIAWYLMKKIH